MKKFTKPILTLALLMLGLTTAMAGEEKVIKEQDYTNPTNDKGEPTTNYPYYWMGMQGNQPYFCNETATVQLVDGSLEINNSQQEQANNWDLQPFILDWFNIQEGGYSYKVKIWLKADNDGSANLSIGTWSGSDNVGLEFQASNDFVEYTAELAAPDKSITSGNNAHVLFQCGKFLGTVWIQKVQLIEVAPDGPVVDPYADWVSVAGDNYVKIYPEQTEDIKVAVPDGDGMYTVECPVKVVYDWDTQFWIGVNQKLNAGAKVRITFSYMASADINVGTQVHEAPGNYVHYGALGDISFKANEWKTYASTYTVPNECNGSDNQGGYKNDFKTIAFNLSQNVSDATGPITFYFKDIDLKMAPEVEPEQFIIPERPGDYIVLEKGQFQQYEEVGPDAVPTNQQPNIEWNMDDEGKIKICGQDQSNVVVGTSTVTPFIWADLSEFESLMVICGKVDNGDAAAARAASPEGLAYRVLYNRSDEKNEAGTDYIPAPELRATSDGQGWAEIDITKDASGAEIPYFHLNTIKGAWGVAENRVFAVMIKQKDTTGIKDINVNEANKGIFDLNGRRVNGVSKGIFIINGQKVVF